MDMDDFIKQFGALADESGVIIDLEIKMDGIMMRVPSLIDSVVFLRNFIAKFIKGFVLHRITSCSFWHKMNMKILENEISLTDLYHFYA
jgi:hypothetical protein